RQDFSTVVKFLYDLKEVVALHQGRLLVPVSPRAIGEKEMALLERDLEVLQAEEEKKR
ncbi:MAG: DUF835 domain-containing protein, partial [Euryarchaeota archaeon]|nr:DUF835 domain-containing protein [Euryarchaeota archaeon]